MPGPAPRSRTKKKRTKSTVQETPPPAQDLETKDVTPDGQTQEQTDQPDPLIEEDINEMIQELREEILNKVMEGCFRVDIERQLVPYSASWAKRYLECQIMCPDEGEGPEELAKTEDSAPVPATIDAWAQRCVPVVTATHQLHHVSQQEADTGPVPIQTEPKINVMTQTKSSPKQDEKEESPRKHISDKNSEVLSPCHPPKTDRKKKQQVTSSSQQVQDRFLPPLSCSSEKKDVKVESKNTGHPVFNNMTRSLKQRKRESLPKLNQSSLPRHCIFPQYEIVDSICLQLNSKKRPRGQSRAGNNKLQTEWTVSSLKLPSCSKEQLEKCQKRNKDDADVKKLSVSRHRERQLDLSGPLRMDTMVLAEGVSLLDPEIVEISPLKFNHPSHSMKLRLIKSDAAVPLFSLEQVTTGPPPRVTPLFHSKSCDI